MEKYKPPLSVFFVYHPADASKVKPIVEYCCNQLQRDTNKPFSRAMNLPVFVYTSMTKQVPSDINILSDKGIIFIFLGKEVVADDYWFKYVESMKREANQHIIPIALDSYAFKVKGVIDKINFIRAYEFNQNYIKDYLFIEVAHEIYRNLLNSSSCKDKPGKENAIKIFLSHAKDNSTGEKIAKSLKVFIDNSHMRNFFDATDIAPGYKFDKEIKDAIENSTLVAIQSDTYPSRYWCQLEIMHAKQHNRPIIAVDCHEIFVDRHFPHATNIPSVHTSCNENITEDLQLKILSAAMLETVRFNYSKLFLEQFIQLSVSSTRHTIYARPPEAFDIEKLLEKAKSKPDMFSRKYDLVLYPEPPLYDEELSPFTSLGIEIKTPLTIGLDANSLRGKSIGISISDPSEEELLKIGQTDKQLAILSQDIARHLLTRNAKLVYGGDLRKNGFTEFLFEEVKILKTQQPNNDINLCNYIAWPIYNNDSKDIATWKANYRDIAQMENVNIPDDVYHLIPNKEIFMPVSDVKSSYVWSRCLTEMRTKMISSCDVRICAGGRHFGYKGKMPGVLEEILIAVKMEKPLYLLGGFGGVTSSICSILLDEPVPEELTEDWQINHNLGYRELLDYSISINKNHGVDYAVIIDILRKADLKNGLTKEDNVQLYATPFIDEAIFLILKGMKELCST